MELLGGLDKEQWLNYVIGLVPRQAAMAEHATFSLQRAERRCQRRRCTAESTDDLALDQSRSKRGT